MSTDSAAGLRLALLVAGCMFLHECLSAPAATKGDLRPVWKWPCGENNPTRLNGPLLSGDPVRHAGSKAIKRVKRVLTLVRQHYQENTKTIDRLYGNFSTAFGESQYQYDWLPRGQLKWYRQHKQCSSEKVPDVLPVLHKSLQNYSVTFEAMWKHGDSQIEKEDLYRIRASLLRNISLWHRQLLCEAETAIHNSRLSVPPWTSTDILAEDKWSFSTDLTQTLMRDWGVIKRYETFLDEWMIIMKSLGNKKLPPVCRGGDGSNGNDGKPKQGGGATQPKKQRPNRRIPGKQSKRNNPPP